MMRRIKWVAMVSLCVGLIGCDESAEDAMKEHIAMIKQIAPSIVRVEYTLRYDKGEAPGGGGGWRNQPMQWSIGRFGNWGWSWFDGEDLIRQERPLEMIGYVLGPDRVVTADNVIHPRFIESVQVRCGDERIDAEVSGYATDRAAVFLKTSTPMPDVKPIEFAADAEPPYLGVGADEVDGEWVYSVGHGSKPGHSVSGTLDGPKYRHGHGGGLLITKEGRGVALNLLDRMPLDDSWKGSPDDWPQITAEEMDAMLDQAEGWASASLLRVKISFRSPKADQSGMFNPMLAYTGEDEDENATERNAVGVLIAPSRILILAEMKPKSTARLERIMVHHDNGDPVAATFVGSLTDYGAFVADLEQPLDGAVDMFDGDIRSLRMHLLPSVQVRVRGEQRIVYRDHRRLTDFEQGWQRNIYPSIMGDAQDVFVFDDQGRLVIAQIAQREKVAVQERYSWGGRARLTRLGQIAPLMDDVLAHCDENNVPLTEEEENRLAWLGVELQGLDRELARANRVSQQTSDGETGALVTYVYPDSPAGQAGIEPGYILLRIQAEGQPKPIEIRMGREMSFFENFPWEQLDQVPEQYFDQIPAPFPSAENVLTRTLTDLGFGTQYTAEFFLDGEPVEKQFTAVQGPKHYGSTRRYKNEPIGVTLRDLTFEVRRHFQKTADNPGVIISKIEPGSKASISGLKPYEIITHVNDQPIMNTGDFERLVAGQAELSLSVLRLTKGRQVKIKMDVADEPDEPEDLENVDAVEDVPPAE